MKYQQVALIFIIWQVEANSSPHQGRHVITLQKLHDKNSCNYSSKTDIQKRIREIIHT